LIKPIVPFEHSIIVIIIISSSTAIEVKFYDTFVGDLRFAVFSSPVLVVFGIWK